METIISGGGAGGSGSHISDGSDQTFMADVVEASQTQPVLVDFWAPWCGPCKTLTPLLEKVVNQRAGKVKLVKINIDENPGIAGQLGVRSIPAVFAFDQGRPVDAFQGALPEGQLNQFIDKLMSGTSEGKQIEEALDRAEQLAQEGSITEAAQLFGAVVEADQTNLRALSGLARCYLDNGDTERAAMILDMAGEENQSDPQIAGVRKALELAGDAPDDAELSEAEAAVASSPDDHEARFRLGEMLMARGRNEEASEQFLTILQADLNWQEGKAKAKLLELFEAAGPKDKATIKGRRRLSSLMFA